ncbi:MAG: hypothetical protein HY255_01305 [Betaproteobacteria bacterium]|nr:hypothetical protein [Betaproteobacteria bacterium]
MNRSLLSAILLLSSFAHAAESDWKQVEESPTSKVLIQVSSIKASGAGKAFTYRVDFNEAQKNAKNGKEYRSVVVKALIVCSTRQMKRGEVNAFAGLGGTGAMVDTYLPTGDEARPFGVAPGNSDEKLLRFVCFLSPPAAK